MTGLRGADRIVRLTAKQCVYLRQAHYLPMDLSSRIAEWCSAPMRSATVSLTLESTLAEQLREILTDRLARVGFDESYGPTAEGELLEDLIDRLLGKASRGGI